MKLTRKQFPQIYWNNRWNYICSSKFTDNNIGAELFCRKLGYKNGKLHTYKNDSSVPVDTNYHDEDSFPIGACREEDVWPNCTGSCSSKDLGGGCYQISPTYNKTYMFLCKALKNRKFVIKCDHWYETPIASCYGISFVIISVNLNNIGIKFKLKQDV